MSPDLPSETTMPRAKPPIGNAFAYPTRRPALGASSKATR
ncbi:hypothetical protein C4D60_Mb02t06680 [Musa balbisiana]|uniref:Uncharacterized protein n=1 Tax=Musa balbisiana TaxID=52838 RepID=A0A4S8I9M6_MUSBA|nr:hypothetical protein C4D60_Mb02t06680 [Musa balbisiana]